MAVFDAQERPQGPPIAAPRVLAAAKESTSYGRILRTLAHGYGGTGEIATNGPGNLVK
jgi:hypothetical protein